MQTIAERALFVFCVVCVGVGIFRNFQPASRAPTPPPHQELALRPALPAAPSGEAFAGEVDYMPVGTIERKKEPPPAGPIIDLSGLVRKMFPGL